MYLDKDIGKIIQSLRVEKGFTQEALSDGLCAVSTISRIENGSQMPTTNLFQNLLERLGEPGFLRGCYWETGNIAALSRKREILEAYEYLNMDSLETLLWEYQNSLDYSDKKEIQFFEYIRLLFWERISGKDYDFVNEALKILRHTRKDLMLEENIDKIIPDGMELLILNGIMMHLNLEKDSIQFINIFKRLYSSANSSKHYMPTYWKTKAALMNNLAIYSLSVKNPKMSITCCNKAISMAAKEGGVLFFMKLLRTRAQVYYLSGMYESAKKDIMLIRSCFDLLSINGGISNGIMSFGEFLEQSKSILIF